MEVSNKMKNLFINLLILVLLAGLGACGGGKKVLISPSDIDAARKSGTLISLYDKAEKIKSESSGSSKKEITQIQSKIANLLTEEREARVLNVLNNNQTEYGAVDKATLSELKASVQDVQRWDLTKYTELLGSVEQASSITNDFIDKALLMQASSKDVVEQLNWMKMIAFLTGKDSDEFSRYEQQKTKGIEQLSSQGREAYKKRMFKMAIDISEKGIIIDPGNIQFESLLSQSQAAFFEQEFRTALESGKPELAYQALVDIADKPIMLQLKKKMQRSILLLANYFASNAQGSYQKNDLNVAYSQFKKGRNIQNILSMTTAGFIQEKGFLDVLMSKVDSATGNAGEKYGLLTVVKEFDPSYPALEEKLSSLLKTLFNRATTKLSVSEFKEVLSSNSVVASVGRRVGSKLEKILFEKLGNQLQIVTNVSNNITNDFSGVALAIDGEVLQAAIETTKNQGQRSINVQTGINKIETEAYAKWKKRKRGDMPVQYFEEKIMEDVTIRVEHIKKIAVVEVAYRIIEPSTQKVLLTNNLTKEAKYLGDSTNEYQKGMFHQKYIEADLPSDIKIMDELAIQLSDELGQSLSNYLGNPEVVFYGKYKSSLERGEINRAIEMLSNAVVMAEGNNKANSEWLSSLKKAVLEKK